MSIANFQEDLRRQLSQRLHRSGITLDAALHPWDVAVRYFDFKRRMIPARRRSVVCSRELEHRPLSPDHQAGLDAIIDDMQVGRHIGPYLTKRWMDLDFNDILFNDWGVCHLHLGGRSTDKDGFVKRTGPVLFACITPNQFYMVDIMQHGRQNQTVFAQKRIIQIIHDNWPQLIASARAPGVSNLFPNDDHTRWSLSRRQSKSHFTLGVETSDGTVYCSPGGGYMANGRSGDAVTAANCLLTTTTRMQRECVENAAHIVESVRSSTGIVLDTLQLQLEVTHLQSGIAFHVREMQSLTIVLDAYQLVLPPAFT